MAPFEGVAWRASGWRTAEAKLIVRHMKILVIGSGGREDALARKIHSDAPQADVFVAPGNPGTARWGTNVPLTADDLPALTGFAEQEGIDLTVVGPEQPLAAGIADVFVERGLPLFGPSAAAARLESSKAFAKDLMRRQGVPTAAFATFTDYGRAVEYASHLPLPVVVKASGLAAGKGAVVCPSHEEAADNLRAMLLDDRFGEAGRRVLVEEFMEGPEVSAFFVCDGTTAVPLGTARDHKRRFEGGRGPNTGGMGAFAPVGDVAPDFLDTIRRIVALPVLEGMTAEGCPYRGFLYVGLILTADGPKVIEFNCRLGDPETQAMLPLLEADLVQPMLAVARGDSLQGWTAEPAPGAALVTVVVSDGYPGTYERGQRIQLPDMEADGVQIYHAGTALAGDDLVTAGGRVVGVTGIAASLEEAAQLSRRGAAAVRFTGATWRRDIGWAGVG